MSSQDADRRWGPFHQDMDPPGRRSYLLWKLAAFYVLALLLYPSVNPGGDDPFGWALIMVAIGWAGKHLVVALWSGRLPIEWQPRPRRPEAPVLAAGEQRTAGEIVRTEIAALGGGAYLGTGGRGRYVLADPESAVMVLGPPRSGKTSAVMIPALLGASGPAISTSTKPDAMRATVAARREVGQAWLFDPCGSQDQLPDGVRRLRWSPVAAASSWDEALIVARAMTACARPAQGTENESHWSERASALLAPLLHAANLTDRPIADVLRWTLRHDLAEAREILAASDAELAADVLVGIEQTDGRERSSILSATAGVLAAYNADAVRESAAAPNFDPARFAASTDTIYVTAPEQRQALCAPLIVGLLEQVRHAVYERSAQEATDGLPMLWALDEIANIAPIHDLPSLVSQAGGQGLQVMVGLQDLSQARGRWGPEVAEGFMSLFSSKLILSGIGDARTLESVSLALGEYDRRTVSSSLGRTQTEEWGSPDSHSETVNYQTQRQRVLSPGEIARLPPGRGLYLRGMDWRLIGLTRWYASEPWRRVGGKASCVV